MTSAKPLTAAGVEHRRKTCMYACVRECATCCGGYRLRTTPPPDAALREAVESLQRMIDMDTFVVGTGEKMRTILRAVQAPRLTHYQKTLIYDACAALDRYGMNISKGTYKGSLADVIRAAFGVGEE